MKLRSLYIKNFASFCESWEIKLNYKLEKPITVFWANNSWKSNFVKAVLYWIWYKYAWEYSFKREDYYFCDTSKPLGVSVSFKDQEEPYDVYDYINFIANFGDGTPETSQRFVWPTWEKSLWKDWRRGMPFYYLSWENLKDQFKTKTQYGTYTVFGRYLNALKEDFNADFEYYQDEVNGKDVKRVEFLKNLLWIISDNVIKTEKFEWFLEEFNNKVEDLEIKFSINEEDFFDKLDLKVRDIPEKPEMSIYSQGNWFIFEILMAFLETISSKMSWNVFLIDTPEKFLDSANQLKFYKKLKKLALFNQVIIVSSSTNFLDYSDPRTILKLDNSEKLWTEVKQTYFIPKNDKEISLLEKSFPEFKNAIYYKKVLFISDIMLYLKAKDELVFENIFFIYNPKIEEDLNSIMNDFWIFTKFVHNEEKDFLTNCEDFLKN